MTFHEQVENIITEAGMYIEDAEPFEGAIKKVRASRKDHYFTFRRDGRQILVKSLEQKKSGSAADKIAMFYLNLQETPYDIVFVVADTTTQDMFKPLIRFFRDRRMTLDRVQVMSLDDFSNFIRRRE
jgi:hypothetical protein